jgi:hypothetical protein
MKRYTIATLHRTSRIVVLDNTPGSSARSYYEDAIRLGAPQEVLISNTNAEWLAKLQGTNSIICELDDYQDLPKLYPELLI